MGNRAYVASTGDGAVLELALPDCQLIHRHSLFTAAEHVNALAPVANGSLWALLHKHGEVSTPSPFHMPTSPRISQARASLAGMALIARPGV